MLCTSSSCESDSVVRNQPAPAAISRLPKRSNVAVRRAIRPAITGAAIIRVRALAAAAARSGAEAAATRAAAMAHIAVAASATTIGSNQFFRTLMRVAARTALRSPRGPWGKPGHYRAARSATSGRLRARDVLAPEPPQQARGEVLLAHERHRRAELLDRRQVEPVLDRDQHDQRLRMARVQTARDLDAVDSRHP